MGLGSRMGVGGVFGGGVAGALGSGGPVGLGGLGLEGLPGALPGEGGAASPLRRIALAGGGDGATRTHHTCYASLVD